MKKHSLKPAIFPRGIKFVKFSSEDNLETSMLYLRTFLERHIIEKPSEGRYILGTHFIKFLPDNMNATAAWQISTVRGKYAMLYNYSDVLKVFVSQRLTYDPALLEIIEHYIKEIQNVHAS